jgi:uncharacterized membrane protein
VDSALATFRSFTSGRRVRTLSGDNRGSIGVVTALTLMVVCGVAGLGLDAAVWYSNAHRVQTIAETTVLSAGHLLSNSSEQPQPSPPSPKTTRC